MKENWFALDHVLMLNLVLYMKTDPTVVPNPESIQFFLFFFGIQKNVLFWNLQDSVHHLMSGRARLLTGPKSIRHFLKAAALVTKLKAQS